MTPTRDRFIELARINAPSAIATLALTTADREIVVGAIDGPALRVYRIAPNREVMEEATPVPEGTDAASFAVGRLIRPLVTYVHEGQVAALQWHP